MRTSGLLTLFTALALTALISLACVNGYTDSSGSGNISTATATVEIQKEPGQFYHAKAKIRYLKKNYEETIEITTEGIEKVYRIYREKDEYTGKNPAREPWLPQLYLLRGAAHQELKNYEPAVEDFRKVIQLRPGDMAGYFNLARVLGLQGKFEEAIKYDIEALKRGPDDEGARKLYEWLAAQIAQQEKESGE